MITRARIALLGQSPFWGLLAMRLKVQADPTCETGWTDGRTLGFNPEWIESMRNEQVVGFWAHEVSHCALGHPWRRDGRDSKGWNDACDKAINPDLKEAGFSLPPDGLYASGNEVGKSAEWIYARQMEKPKGKGGQKPGKGQGQQPGQQNGQGQGQGQPDPNAKPEPKPFGEVRDAPKDADEDGTPAPGEQDWKNAVQAAKQQAEMMGNMPGGALRAVEQALEPKIDVKSLLLRFFQERTASDYSWARPNTRFLSQGLYLPSLDSKSLGEVAIMVDTSGSIDRVALNHARGIVQEVLDECNPQGLTLYFADAKVCNRQRMEKGEPLTWEPKGNGGTDFRPALKAIEEDQVVCAVCITDLEGTFPQVPPDYPVIWLATKKHTAPFGETVFVDQ